MCLPFLNQAKHLPPLRGSTNSPLIGLLGLAPQAISCHRFAAPSTLIGELRLSARWSRIGLPLRYQASRNKRENIRNNKPEQHHE
jgi:hypothetical protein